MASTYSNTGIELIGVGEQANTWGQTTNTNWRLMEELVSGVIDVSLNGLTSYTLTTVDGLTSNGRHMVVRFTGTPGGPVTVTVSPNEMQKVYLINNETTQSVTVAQGSGATVEIPSNSKKIIYCDGEGATASVQDMFSGEFSGDFSGTFSGDFDGNFSGDFDGDFTGTGDFSTFSLDGTEVTITATQINGAITAAGTSYDNTDSGATATNAQDAFDEVFTVINDLDFSAGAIDYDNITTGISATNAQDAIDQTYERADTFVANDGRVKTAVNASGSAPIHVARAFATFSGTGVFSDGKNISSVVFNSTGNYTINFTEDMETDTYTVITSSIQQSTQRGGNFARAFDKTVSSMKIVNWEAANSQFNAEPDNTGPVAFVVFE